VAVEIGARSRVFHEHDRVVLTTDAHGVPRGTSGTVISAAPQYDVYVVDVTDGDGRLVTMITASARELELYEVA